MRHVSTAHAAVRGGRRILCTVLLCCFGGSAAAHAQLVDTVPTPKRNQFVRVAKWTTLAASAGAAVYGFTTSRRADDGYAALETLCEENRPNCENRINGAYADADMERRYQEVLDLDGKARTALTASQVGVAATVLLFIYDLRNPSSPKGIPYEPRALQITPARDGALALSLRLRLKSP
ncbi:MAG TPA: hypothetical protein VF035_09770 [Longimicrobiales bacterium]